MREIKFRVWNPVIKKMEKLNLYNIELEWPKLQYAGLKDANGKEIYEGDILQWADGDNSIGVVEWLEGDACFDIELFNFGGFTTNPILNGFNVDKVKGYKVIGNIYENPELLEENK